MDQTLQIATIISTAIIGLSGFVISFLLYRLNTRLREDAWLLHFNEIHDKFWNDPELKLVRLWVSSEASYTERLEPLLDKVRKNPSDAVLLPDEYDVLDKLDKFLNLMVRVLFLHPQIQQQRDLLHQLFFTYWICRARGDGGPHDLEHPALRWYVETFYPQLAKAVPSR